MSLSRLVELAEPERQSEGGVGRDETVIRENIKNQEKEDQKLDRMKLWR